MYVIWIEQEQEQEVEYGQRLHGMKRKGHRPDTILFTEEEKSKVDWPEEKHRDYYHRMLIPALKCTG